jgi:hypothetical protein
MSDAAKAGKTPAASNQANAQGRTRRARNDGIGKNNGKGMAVKKRNSCYYLRN